jgi:O-acetyl-ADP-ribose deacetylase (regulator of RNase III)
MSINVVKGDLLQATEDAIGHGCNCRKTMGSGVAKALRSKWPAVYAADMDFDKAAGRNKIGMFSTTQVGGKQVYNIYTQVDFLPRGIDHFQYVGFELGLKNVFRHMKENNLKSLALPKIGAGLAGGDWQKIKKIIVKVSDEEGIPVTIYEI